MLVKDEALYNEGTRVRAARGWQGAGEREAFESGSKGKKEVGGKEEVREKDVERVGQN